MDSLAAAATTCGLHPGVAVTGFCAACLRERLAGLDPASSSASALKSSFSRPPHHHFAPPELRRCKSFSYTSGAGYLEPQRRSCDVRGTLFQTTQAPPPGGEIDIVPEAEGAREIGEAGFSERPMKEHIDRESSRKPPHKDLKEIAGSLWMAASMFSKRWQEWRHKHRLKKQQQQEEGNCSMAAAAAMPLENPRRQRQHRSRDTQSEVAMDALGRRSCDTDPRFSVEAGRFSVDVPKYSLDEPRASWDGYLVPSGGRPAVGRLPPMLSVVEDVSIPRSDGQIPVEEDAMVPGGSAQTRDYYLDSSSRRRRSLERLVSARKSFSDANEPHRLIACPNANARVSPAMGTEFYHYNHPSSFPDNDFRDPGPNSLRDDISESFESAFRDYSKGVRGKKSKKWIKGWNIWGLMQKKGSSKEAEAASVADRSFSESWPELRARGYDGQMLRCNSSVSARSSLSASTSTALGRSARRSGVDVHVNGHVRTRRDELLLERNRSGRYSPSRADNGVMPHYLNAVGGSQTGRPNRMSGNGRPVSSSRSLSGRTARLY